MIYVEAVRFISTHQNCKQIKWAKRTNVCLSTFTMLQKPISVKFFLHANKRKYVDCFIVKVLVFWKVITKVLKFMEIIVYIAAEFY